MYRVTVCEVERPVSPSGSVKAKGRVPVEYTVPARTPLKKVDVPPASRTFDIALVARPGPKR